MRSFVLALFVLLPVTAYGGQQIRYATRDYKHKGVVIQADEVFQKKDKIWFRLRVVNQTGKFLTIDKQQLQLKVGGATLAREKGVFGKYAKPNTIAAGVSGELNVEFVIGEVPQPVL